MALRTIGLGGDGDEVDAIEAAFARFGAGVPIEDARDWVTVGDVWTSLERRLPQAGNQPDSWRRFVETLCAETGADSSQVSRETRLLA